MQLSVEGPNSGHHNMQADVEALERAEAGKPSARVYEWTGLWVSLGRFQKPEQALIRPEMNQWVIRPTGGKAVIHGSDLTFSLATPIDSVSDDSRAIKQTYRKLIRPLVDAMNACGLPAVLGEDSAFVNRGSRVADCFAFNSANDVLHRETGQKVCGCALRITDRAVLLQASIPVRPYPISASTLVLGGIDLPISDWDSSRFSAAIDLALHHTFDR